MVPTINNSYKTCCAQFSLPEQIANPEFNSVLALRTAYPHLEDGSIAIATSRVLGAIRAVDDNRRRLSALHGKTWSRIETMQLLAQERDREHGRDTPSFILNASQAEKIIIACFQRSVEDFVEETESNLNAAEVKEGTLLFGMPEAKSLLAGQVPVEIQREKERILQKLKVLRGRDPIDTSAMPELEQQFLLTVDRKIAELEWALSLMTESREGPAIASPADKEGSTD